MRLYSGKDFVKKGVYFDYYTGRVINMPKSGELPAEVSQKYIRFSNIGLVFLAPIMGLVFAMFLPFIAIAAFIVAIFYKLGFNFGNNFVRYSGFGWRPIESYLLGRRNKDKK